MPKQRTIDLARRDQREGKSASTQAGEFVREEIELIRKGAHGVRSTKQAIAIGLSKARRAGVKLPPPKAGKASEKTREKSRHELEKARQGGGQPVSRKRSRWGPLLKAGVRMYEHGPALYHCKYMVVDGCWSSVGSTNLDNRSLRLNAEANLNVHDAKFAGGHERLFAKDRAVSKEITLEDWQRRPMGEKMLGCIGNVLRTQM